MSKFLIRPHMRLQEWVADERGHFTVEGLKYEFETKRDITDGRLKPDPEGKGGVFRTYEAGRTSDVSCACHWTVNVAASSGHGQIYPKAYSVTPCGLFAHPDSRIETPEDLAGVPVSVNYRSGSHYSTLQAMERFLNPDDINLTFDGARAKGGVGGPFSRLTALVDGETQVASLFSGAYYFAYQLGFKKIIETTFMIATMITGDPEAEQVDKYFRGLKRAQADIDLRPELYVKFYKNEFPERFHDEMDLRQFGPGERIVFEPYSAEIFQQTRDWIRERGIFNADEMGADNYNGAIYAMAEE